MKRFDFQKWKDGPTNPKRDISVVGPMTLDAVYVEVTPMGKVTFKGTVTSNPPNTNIRDVSVVVTLPDGSKDTLPSVRTDDQGAYITSKDYLLNTVAYLAIANAAEDNLNKAGSSPVKTFIVTGKADTIVTLDVVQ